MRGKQPDPGFMQNRCPYVLPVRRQKLCSPVLASDYLFMWSSAQLKRLWKMRHMAAIWNDFASNYKPDRAVCMQRGTGTIWVCNLPWVTGGWNISRTFGAQDNFDWRRESAIGTSHTKKNTYSRLIVRDTVGWVGPLHFFAKAHSVKDGLRVSVRNRVSLGMFLSL